MTEAQLREIWEKTNRHCHFCGGRPGGSGLYSCCSAAHIRDQLGRRTPGKSWVIGFLHQIRIYNEIIPDDSDY